MRVEVDGDWNRVGEKLNAIFIKRILNEFLLNEFLCILQNRAEL